MDQNKKKYVSKFKLFRDTLPSVIDQSKRRFGAEVAHS